MKKMKHENIINKKYTADGLVCLNGYSSYTSLNEQGYIVNNGNSESLQSNRNDLIAYSRSFYRNNSIYKGMIDRLVTYIIGSGYKLQVQTKNQGFNQKFEQAFKEYWEFPEIRGVLSGVECEKMVCRETLLCGDNGTIFLDNMMLQIVESEQIRQSYSPNDTGITTNEYGKAEMYHIAPYGKFGQVDTANAKDVNPDNFLFVADLDRPSSLRGVPSLQSSFSNLNRLADIFDSEAISWQLLSRMAIAIMSDSPAQDPAEIGTLQDDYDATDPSLTPNITDFEYGTVFRGAPGDKVESIDRNIPSKNFTDSVKIYLRMIGLPVSMPLELLLLDWTKSNYSQSKSTISQFSKTIASYSQLQISHWYNKIVERFYNNLLLTGQIKERPDFAFTWIQDPAPQLDPQKETEANEKAVANGSKTFADVLKSEGKDPEAHKETLLREDIEAEQLRQRFEAETGQEGDANRYKGIVIDPAYTKAEVTEEETNEEQ